MLTLSPKSQWLVGGILLLVMLITRAHVTNHLQDASWAVFFLAGFYLRKVLAFGVFMVTAVAIDFVAITQFGVSDFCVSSAYVALVPAYGALFMAGRWFASQHQGETLASLGKLALAVLVGFTVAQVISSGSFYFFSGHFTALSMAEFGSRLLKYAPHGLYVTTLYITIGVFVHVAVSIANRPLMQRK